MTLLISLVLFHFLIVRVASQAMTGLIPYYVKTTSINCYGNPDLLVNITCRLKPINWEKTVAIMDSDLVGIVRNASLRLELFKFSYTNQFHPFLLNITLNLCKFLETRKGNPYGKMVVSLLSHYTNVNHSCPYWGHLAAYGAYLDSRFVPFVIPSAKYKVIFTFYEGWPMVHLGTVITVGSVIERSHMPPQPHPKRRPKRTLVANNLLIIGAYTIYRIS